MGAIGLAIMDLKRERTAHNSTEPAFWGLTLAINMLARRS